MVTTTTTNANKKAIELSQTPQYNIPLSEWLNVLVNLEIIPLNSETILHLNLLHI